MPESVLTKLLCQDEAMLVIIDVQEKLLPVIHGKEEILQNLVRLNNFADIIHLPKVFTEQQKLGPTVPELQNDAKDARVFSKMAFDCLAEEDFRSFIAQSGKQTLILAGIESHICVAQTALSASSQYQVHVVADAVGSRSPHNKAIALDRLRQEGIKVTSTEMVIYELLRKAGTPEFKATLPLVK